jgi:16S rRNA (uracil1498-N3)-methyltransferase
MHVFYTPDIESNEYDLNEDESRHCVKVLRLGTGARVHLIDGRGHLYMAEIIAVSKKNVRLQILEVKEEYNKRNHHLHIAVAPTKNIERLEWFLEKATEIGIDEITPIICDRSERKIVKIERLVKVITSAVKQSLQAYHPVLRPQIRLVDFLSQSYSSTKLIAHCNSDDVRQYISEVSSVDRSYTVLIGPEGDFTNEEIYLALQNDYKPITLGNTRLRTETAALQACFEVNYINR